MKKTSKEWQEELNSVIVLDPDGWDRKNYNYSWNEELITKDEYYVRVSYSTCKFEINNWYYDYEQARNK